MSEVVIEKKAGFSLKEAVENMTVGEIEAIERHYGKSFPNEMSGTSLTASLVWALERRKFTGDEKPDWKSIETWTLRDLNSYFEEEEIEIDPEEPETEAGKEVALDA